MSNSSNKIVSKSPERHTFQKEGYVRRQLEKGEPVNEDYLDYFQKIIEESNHKFDDPQSRIRNMEYDLLTTDWILEKVRADEAYAQNLYAAMCNNGFIKLDVIPILKQEEWSASWRYAGGLVAEIRNKGEDYMDFYCSGNEGHVTSEITHDLLNLGWVVKPYEPRLEPGIYRNKW